MTHKANNIDWAKLQKANRVIFGDKAIHQTHITKNLPNGNSVCIECGRVFGNAPDLASEQKTERSDRELAQIQKQVTLGKIAELEKLVSWSLKWENHHTDFAVTKVNAIDIINYKNERLKALQAELGKD